MKRLFSLLFFIPTFVFADYFVEPTNFRITQNSKDYSSWNAAESTIQGWILDLDKGRNCAYLNEIVYMKQNRYQFRAGGCSSSSWDLILSCPSSSTLDSSTRLCSVSECPSGMEPDDQNVCREPEPVQCEAGEQSSVRKFLEDGVVDSHPPKVHVNGCVMEYVGNDNCAWPYSQERPDGTTAIGAMCDVVYEQTGDEAPTTENEIPGEGEDPESEVPEELPESDDATPSGPDPDENNSCPPGYAMQGNTCFRIPPDHPDYDPDKDPMPGGGSGNNGDSDQDGDWGKESTLKDIDKTLKDIDRTGKAIESATKSGNATTHDLLRDVIGAIEGIPGGGGTGPGDGDGDGEDGDFDGGCDDETCGFGERDLFGDEVPGFSDSLNTIHDGIKNSPIGQSISSIQFPSGGTCPTGSISIDVMGGSIPLVFDSHCDLWETIRPVISVAFLALWALLAVRVFLSA